jgi:hypothetical protein
MGEHISADQTPKITPRGVAEHRRVQSNARTEQTFTAQSSQQEQPPLPVPADLVTREAVNWKSVKDTAVVVAAVGTVVVAVPLKLGVLAFRSLRHLLKKLTPGE